MGEPTGRANARLTTGSAKPIAPHHAWHDGYRFAPPILRSNHAGASAGCAAGFGNGRNIIAMKNAPSPNAQEPI
jgi:hypothetical protein